MLDSKACVKFVHKMKRYGALSYVSVVLAPLVDLGGDLGWHFVVIFILFQIAWLHACFSSLTWHGSLSWVDVSSVSLFYSPGRYPFEHEFGTLDQASYGSDAISVVCII